MTTYPTRHFKDAIFDREARTVHFFNGRLLSAEELRKEQAANQSEHRKLGQAVGDGIVYGLEVTATAANEVAAEAYPALTIAPGLAIDRRGQTITLGETVRMSLTGRRSATPSSAAPTVFEVCVPGDSNVYVADAGLYVLAITSVQGQEGRALVSGLNNDSNRVEQSCNSKYHVPGVQFRLIPLDIPPGALNDPQTLRNRFAYRCFGANDTALTGFVANPFGPPVTGYGWLDTLRPNRLQACEVPLALVYLTATQGLVFADMWSVRRRVTALPADPRWLTLLSDRRAAEGEAMFFQFMQHINDLKATLDAPEGARARTHFRYLPPVGFVPLASDRFQRGFHEELFFDEIPHHPVVFIEGARVEALVRTGLAYPPTDTTSGVSLYIYRVRENEEAIVANPATAPQPYLIFTTGHMAYMGDAHFDVNRWGYGNYA